MIGSTANKRVLPAVLFHKFVCDFSQSDNSSKNQVEIKRNRSRLCDLGNGEFFWVNFRNQLLKFFIIKRDKVINITIITIDNGRPWSIEI